MLTDFSVILKNIEFKRLLPIIPLYTCLWISSGLIPSLLFVWECQHCQSNGWKIPNQSIRHSSTSKLSLWYRAAQKLSLTTKKKHKKEKGRRQEGVMSQHTSAPVSEVPLRRASQEIKPYPFPTNFKESLRKSSPSVPPSLLKMNKRTDGKVSPTAD